MWKEILQLKHKHKHDVKTCKKLVCIYSNGIISFVLYLSTVSVSGKVLTKCLGLLEKLEQEDNIMVDRGFDNADILSSGVILNILASQGSKSLIKSKAN